MNEAEVRFPHFPGLLHKFGQHSAPHYVAWMIPVQINVHCSTFYDEFEGSPSLGSTYEMGWFRQGFE